jgi:hypothetical protein
MNLESLALMFHPYVEIAVTHLQNVNSQIDKYQSTKLQKYIKDEHSLAYLMRKVLFGKIIRLSNNYWI